MTILDRTIFEQNTLGIQLVPISIKELLILNQTPCPIYSLDNGIFIKILEAQNVLSKKILKQIIKNYSAILFVLQSDLSKLIEQHQTHLRNITRSISIGNITEKGKQHFQLLSTNMHYLYNNPIDDNALSIQYQSTKNLAYFLMDNQKIHRAIFEDYIKQNYHYVIAQPLISSLFLLGVLKQSDMFAPKEIVSLFITSYFKDIGMSTIPMGKYDTPNLTEQDKKVLGNHANASVSILKSRINLTTPYLKIIKNHHNFSILNNTSVSELGIISEDDTSDLLITGFESMIISVMDIIAAMLSSRPYRQECSLYDALELIKVLISDKFPREFKLIVHYFRKFFNY